MNHIPHLSEHNRPQGWHYNLVTKQYAPAVPESDRAERASHGATSPAGKQIGYFRPGLAYRPKPGQPLIYIGGLGGDGHMAFLYQDEIAVSGDVSSEGLVTMILPDTRNVIPVSYSQNVFTGYYGSIVFVSMSPDATKLAFTSDMMGCRDIYWGIMNYPQPPRNVRTASVEGGVLVRWEKPEWSAEVAGYLVYRSTASGTGYALLTRSPVQATRYVDAAADPAKSHFYVVRSVEHSGLASRAFSNEGAWGGDAEPLKRRLYCEAEHFDRQGVPFRLMNDLNAVNEKYMWIHPVNEEAQDGVGEMAYTISIPTDADYTLWVRAKRGAGSGADCRLVAGLGGKQTELHIKDREWTWRAFPLRVSLHAGGSAITLMGSGNGLGIDRFLLTNDPSFTPSGMGSDVDTPPPRPVNGLHADEAAHFHTKLTWTPSADAELQHYQVYRKRGIGVEATQNFLVGSPGKPRFLDYNLRPGQTYSYTVTAVDNWGNESKAGPVVTVETASLKQRVIQRIDLAKISGLGWPLEPLPDDKSRKVLRPRFDKTPKRQALRIPFHVPVDGVYVIWLRAVAENQDYERFWYQVDDEPQHGGWLPSPEYKKGQSNAERIQWERLMARGEDAGTKWALRQGSHVLTIKPLGSGPGTFIIEDVLVTNDLSHILIRHGRIKGNGKALLIIFFRIGVITPPGPKILLVIRLGMNGNIMYLRLNTLLLQFAHKFRPGDADALKIEAHHIEMEIT